MVPECPTYSTGDRSSILSDVPCDNTSTWSLPSYVCILPRCCRSPTPLHLHHCQTRESLWWSILVALAHFHPWPLAERRTGVSGIQNRNNQFLRHTSCIVSWFVVWTSSHQIAVCPGQVLKTHTKHQYSHCTADQRSHYWIPPLLESFQLWLPPHPDGQVLVLPRMLCGFSSVRCLLEATLLESYPTQWCCRPHHPTHRQAYSVQHPLPYSRACQKSGPTNLWMLLSRYLHVNHGLLSGICWDQTLHHTTDWLDGIELEITVTI